MDMVMDMGMDIMDGDGVDMEVKILSEKSSRFNDVLHVKNY